MLELESLRSVRKQARIAIPQYSKEWKPVKDFPNLKHEKILGFDVETYDPELKEAGPGWGRGVGHIVGISIATIEKAWYFPIAHIVQSELNLSAESVFKWLDDTLNSVPEIVGANLYYDLGWLLQHGITYKGRANDIIVAEKLIDFTQYKYDLESIAQKYVGEGKVSDTLYKWCAQAYGGKATPAQRANIYRTPPSLCGPYAESDAILPIQIFEKQKEILWKDGLWDVYDIEARLLPLLVKMRFRGAPISEERTYYARDSLQTEIDIAQQELNEMAEFNINVNSAVDLEKLFTKLRVPILYTEKGNPSFQKEWLEAETHPAAGLIRKIRTYKKTISTFLEGAILEKQVNGRVYTQFNQMGAITGRFSSNSPNLQNIPKRDKKIGPVMRSIFHPEAGMQWIKLDYSSVEFRIFAHFVHTYLNDTTLYNAYKKDPNIDFHQIVADLVRGNVPRVAYKTISFTSMYAGGRTPLTKQMQLNFTEEERKRLIQETFQLPVLSNSAEQLAILISNLYHKKFPVVKKALDYAMNKAETTGEMRTVLGRRVTYNLWEPRRGKGIALPYEEARRRYRGQIRRAKTYRALNVYNQGSSADIMKTAMVLAYEEGLFDDDKLGPPHLTVHDELDFSYHDDLKNEFKQLIHIMEHAIELSIPLIVEPEIGPNWGEAKEVKL